MRKLNTEYYTKFESRSYLVSVFTAIFAFVYHFACLTLFGILHVKQMFYFNFFSILLFGVIIVFKLTEKNLFLCYIVSLIEVIFHQIFAIYCIGYESSFHYLIVLIGILPLVIFDVKFIRSVVLSLTATIVFIILSIFSDKFPGVYSINPTTIKIIKSVNISVSFIIILCVIIMFTAIVHKNEEVLKNTIKRTRGELIKENVKIIRLQKNAIVRIANLVENRDSETGQHVKRTSTFVRIIAEEAFRKGLYKDELNRRDIQYMFNTAPLHDIGKIVVSDTILKKPGKLTDEEFEEMKKHTTEGERIISEVFFDVSDKNYFKYATEIACYHHEKWDGSGYPKGLKGRDIPISARIMALADVYDALVSERCYKKAKTVDEAFDIIKEGIGNHFDPELGKLFIEIRDKISSVII